MHITKEVIDIPVPFKYYKLVLHITSQEDEDNLKVLSKWCSTAAQAAWYAERHTVAMSIKRTKATERGMDDLLARIYMAIPEHN